MAHNSTNTQLRKDAGLDRLETRKRAAADFLHMIALGETDEAYAKFVALGFIHHNPYFAGDADSLKAGMADNARQFPQKALNVLRVIGEGDLVAGIRASGILPASAASRSCTSSDSTATASWNCGISAWRSRPT